MRIADEDLGNFSVHSFSSLKFGAPDPEQCTANLMRMLTKGQDRRASIL